MSELSRSYLIIPAYNEEKSVGRVIADLPGGLLEEIIVVDNNSTDNTSKVASEAGAFVLFEEKKGYGSACLKGISHLKGKAGPDDIIVFMDADYSDFPAEITQIIEPVRNGSCDMVIGSRNRGKNSRDSMTPHQRFGNKLASGMISLFYGVNFTDLGPFRAIRYKTLMDLRMEDRNFGWTVEMQVKAAKNRIRWTEVPVSYRKRIGVSKVSGTFTGSVMAGYKIISTILRYA